MVNSVFVGFWPPFSYDGSTTAFTGNVSVTGQFYGPAADNTAAPPFSFLGDTNTGVGSSAADTLNLVTGGTSRVTVTNTGATFAGFILSGGDVRVPAASTFYWENRSLLTSPANGQANLTNNAASAGVGLDFSSDGLLLLRNRALSAYANFVANDITAQGWVYVAQGQSFANSNRGRLTAPADGVWQFIDNAGTGFTRLILGTNDASGVAWKLDSGAFSAREGDDSGWADVNAATFGSNTAIALLTVNSQKVQSGSGSPEASVTAPVGSIYLRTDGGAGTSFYVKESGAGNTGWVGK